MSNPKFCRRAIALIVSACLARRDRFTISPKRCRSNGSSSAGRSSAVATLSPAAASSTGAPTGRLSAAQARADGPREISVRIEFHPERGALVGYRRPPHHTPHLDVGKLRRTEDGGIQNQCAGGQKDPVVTVEVASGSPFPAGPQRFRLVVVDDAGSEASQRSST